MNALPDELVVIILSFSGAKAVASFALTCKKYAIISQDDYIWKILCERNKYCREPERKCSYKYFFRLMNTPVKIKYTFCSEKDAAKELAIPNEYVNIAQVLRKIGEKECMPPHSLFAYELAPERKICSTNLMFGGVLIVGIENP
ncbi:hypothetical protein PMV_400 [Port-miou virus]|uniref:F-box domain-containing protein n=1 Tax=Port-miou virus TaxID=1733873 RepID=A0A0N9PZE9_9VIRU|nr:hypothetical protein PMV_400 [Port-miou virus]